MPTINVDLSNVGEFENLPDGTYLTELTRFYHAPDSGDYGQLRAVWTVIEEGEFLGRTSTEFLSLSPKAAFRIARFLKAFGEELDDDFKFETDDDDEIISPDLVGAQAIIKVETRPDKKTKEPRTNTSIVSVEEMPDGTSAVAPEPEEDDEEEEEEAPKTKAAPTRQAPARRAVAAAAAPKRRSLR